MLKMKKQVIQQQNKQISQEQNQKLGEQLAAFTKNIEDFAYQDEKYYYSDEGKCKSTSEEKAFQKIKTKM